jgi:hypothetical protein
MRGMRIMADIKYEIKETLGILSENNRGWSPEHEKMGKGVTLSVEEMKKLRDLLNDLDL